MSPILDTTCGDLSNDYYYSSEDTTQEPDVTDPKITEIETQLSNNTTTVSRYNPYDYVHKSQQIKFIFLVGSFGKGPFNNNNRPCSRCFPIQIKAVRTICY